MSIIDDFVELAAPGVYGEPYVRQPCKQRTTVRPQATFVQEIGNDVRKKQKQQESRNGAQAAETQSAKDRVEVHGWVSLMLKLKDSRFYVEQAAGDVLGNVNTVWESPCAESDGPGSEWGDPGNTIVEEVFSVGVGDGSD